MMYLIASLTQITMLFLFSTTFLTMMRSGAVHHNGAVLHARFLFFFTLFDSFKKFNKNISYEGNSKKCPRKI